MEKKLFTGIVTAALFLLSGCTVSHFTAGSDPQSVAVADSSEGAGQHARPASMARLAAIDLVNALMQVDQYHPSGAALRVQPAESEFARELVSVLEVAGYQLEKTDSEADGDIRRLLKTGVKTNPDNSSAATYEIRVDDIRLRRDYRSSNGMVSPASYLYALGVSAGQLTLNDQIFDQAPGDFSTTEVPADIAQSAGLLASGQQTPETAPLKIEPAKVKQPEVKPLEANKEALVTVGEVSGSSAKQLASKPAPIAMWVNGQRDPKPFTRGEELVLTLNTTNDVEVFCYYRDAGNTVVRVYPNRFSQKSGINAGEVLRIPAVDDWSIKAAETAATEEFMCIASNPSQPALLKALESNTDFEPLLVASFDQLLDQLNQVSGVRPSNSRIGIQTY